MGQVASVAVDSAGNVVLFHRADRAFDGSTFDLNNVLNQKETPITTPTLLHLDRVTGQVMHAWGDSL